MIDTIDLDRHGVFEASAGTGKTYTAARVIAHLVNENRWRIGVVAQSHAVVENVRREAIRAGVDPALVAKKSGQDPRECFHLCFICVDFGLLKLDCRLPTYEGI